jgi:thymidylate kinase
LGKSTLIEGIRNKLGYYQVIHFSKPEVLDYYNSVPDGTPQYWYQYFSFVNSMHIAKSAGARIIFDRWHIGEVVYSPMYRGYSGDYVYDLEEKILGDTAGIKLILLTEDFKVSRHFVDDGQSLGPSYKREEEQNRFIDAFHRSNIKNKQIINVTNRDGMGGGFRQKWAILEEALR